MDPKLEIVHKRVLRKLYNWVWKYYSSDMIIIQQFDLNLLQNKLKKL